MNVHGKNWRALEESELVLLKDGKTVIPSRFAYRGNPLPGKPDVEVEIVVEAKTGEAPSCREVRIVREEGRINWEVLREIPVKLMEQEAVAQVVADLPIRHMGSTPMPTSDKPDRTVHRVRLASGVELANSLRAANESGRSGRTRLTDEHLAEVARLYREALESEIHRRSPVEYVAREMLGEPWKAKTAKRWVQKAREKGLLPRTSQGKTAA